MLLLFPLVYLLDLLFNVVYISDTNQAYLDTITTVKGQLEMK